MSGELGGIMLFILTKEFSDEIFLRMLGKTKEDFFELEEIDSSVLMGDW
ncbi:hypothetical protein [Sporofaciens musculi]|nr:hypothetical protein [Sporofaciens musculi]